MLLPSPSNRYAVTVNFKISDAVWNAALPHLAGRVEELEAVVVAGYAAAQEAGTAMAEAIIRDSVAPQIEDINATITGFQTSLALAEDQLAALQNGGVQAVNVPLAPYGLFPPGTDAQEAFNFLSDSVEEFDLDITLLFEQKMDEDARGAANGVAPLGADQKVPEANIQGRTLRIGEVLRTPAKVAPSGFLPLDGGKYLKSAYPDLVASIPETTIWDVSSGSVPTGAADSAIRGIFLAGDFAITGASTELVLANLKTGAITKYTIAGLNANYFVTAAAAHPTSGTIFIYINYTSNVIRLVSVNPSTMALTDNVTQNIPASIGVRRLFFTEAGVWNFLSLDGRYYRGTGPNAMVQVTTPSALSTAGVVDVGEPNASGRMYMLVGTSTGSGGANIYRSDNFGASWSLVGPLLDANGSPMVPGQAVSSASGATRFVLRNGDMTYVRSGTSTSGGNQGALWIVSDDDQRNLVQQSNNLGTQNGGLYLVAGMVVADTGANARAYDISGNNVTAEEFLASTGTELSAVGLSGDLDWHPRYGQAQFSRTTTFRRRYSPHNYDTEFRLPRRQGISVRSYIKAAA